MISFGMPAADYHAIKALSAGMALTLVEECPLRAWIDSPFNPKLVREENPVFDIGTAAHLAVLEPELLADRVLVHGHSDYRTKEARAIRDGAYAAGKTPLKQSEWDVVHGAAAAIARGPAIASRLFSEGHSEVSLTWEWDGVPCKARPDYLPDSGEYMVDLKTAISANPRTISRKAFVEGWHMRAAWYLAGCAEVLGRRPAHYWFVVVEKAAPHIVEVYEIDARGIAWGEQMIVRALRLFKECSASGCWPGYRGVPTTIELPTWAEYQMADRQQAGEFNERYLDA